LKSDSVLEMTAQNLANFYAESDTQILDGKQQDIDIEKNKPTGLGILY
jgi:hypothetical protein